MNETLIRAKRVKLRLQYASRDFLPLSASDRVTKTKTWLYFRGTRIRWHISKVSLKISACRGRSSWHSLCYLSPCEHLLLVESNFCDFPPIKKTYASACNSANIGQLYASYVATDGRVCAAKEASQFMTVTCRILTVCPLEECAG